MILICLAAPGRWDSAVRIPGTNNLTIVSTVGGLAQIRVSADPLDQLAVGGSRHHGSGRWSRAAPVRVRHQRPGIWRPAARLPGIWRPAAARLPDKGAASVQPRPVKSGVSPPDASFLIRSQTFPHGSRRYRGYEPRQAGVQAEAAITPDGQETRGPDRRAARLPDRPAVGSA